MIITEKMVIPTKNIMIVKNFLTPEQTNRIQEIISKSVGIDESEYKVDTKLTALHIDKEDFDFQENLILSIYKEIYKQFGIKEQDVKINNNIMNNKTINLLSEGPGMPVHHDEDFKNRYGIVLYLNNDYEGGELFYKNFGISLTPEVGTLVVHPATELYSHGVKPITRGVRYTLTMFIQNEEEDATFEICKSWDE